MKWWTKSSEFLADVRTELKKTTWPSRTEVRGTTVVVIITSFIFAFYLWVVDLGVRRVVGKIMELFTA